MTKHTKWIFAVLLTALITVPAFAQTGKEITAKVTNFSKAIEQAALKAQQKAQRDSCFYCQRPIEEKYQHCEHSGYTGICSPVEKKNNTSSVPAAPKECPICGEELTIDQRFHGDDHICPDKAQTTVQKSVCDHCGQTFTEGDDNNDHCPGLNYIGPHSNKKDNASSVPAAPKECPICGEELTIDQRYHGEQHRCQADTTQAPEYCIYCGEEFKTGQTCSAQTNGTCTVYCPECHQNLRDPKNLGPNGEHRCRFKTRIKPAEIKK